MRTGRKPTYHSDEERRAATNAASRKYYRSLKGQQTRATYTAALPVDYGRNAQLKWRLGSSVADKAARLSAQGMRCKACRSDTPAHKSGWVVDHIHGLNKSDPRLIRGILCQPCNLALGLAKESRHRLWSLMSYLGDTVIDAEDVTAMLSLPG